MVKVLLLFSLLLLFSCQKKVNVAPVKDTASLKQLANEKYNSPVKFIPNGNGKYTICMTVMKQKVPSPNRSVRFFVYDNIRKQVIFEDFVHNGSVDWEDGETVKVTRTPGIVKKDEAPRDNAYFYNVKTNKKVKK